MGFIFSHLLVQVNILLIIITFFSKMCPSRHQACKCERV